MYTVSPRQGESYYLRLLLHEVKGPQNFDDLKRVSGTLCQTFREACQRRGLMEDDNHLKMALEEAASCRSPCALRSLFVMILTACKPANPLSLWLLHCDSMTEDILNSHQQELSNNSIQVIDQEPEAFSVARQQQLTVDQYSIYTTFVSLVEAGQGGMVFVDAPGGTGKTYLMNILSTVRSHETLALATASSGIAAALLTGGRTLHFTFKIVSLEWTHLCVQLRGDSIGQSDQRLPCYHSG